MPTNVYILYLIPERVAFWYCYRCLPFTRRHCFTGPLI